MAGTGRQRSGARMGGIDFGWDQPDQPPAHPDRKVDWKRWFLVLGLGGLSWVATFVGMLELIEANVGDLSFGHRLIIGFSVAMLMVMVVWLLDQIFSDIHWTTRLLFVGGYAFLTLISVGFGFGFYWKVLESRGEASRSAESAVGQVQSALHAGVTRLEQLQGTLDGLTALSSEKALLERDKGTSCPNSRPGDGPRRQLRDDDASRFKFSADFVRGRVGTLKTELAGLNGDLAKVVANDRSTIDAATGTRNDYMRGLNRRLDMTVTGFNAFRSDPQLRQIRSDLADRADRVSFTDARGAVFQCPDAQLSAALKGVVRAIDELPTMEKPKIAAVEGEEAVIEAFRRLSASLFGALSFKMPPSPEELRELQKRAVQSVEASPATQARLNAMAAEAGLSKRDYIPLAIAMFVDLCLLLVSIKRPARGLDRLLPKMRAAEEGPVIQILSRFNEIHRDREIRENFELFRHVVFDFHGDYYAAIPLNAPCRPGAPGARPTYPAAVSQAEALQQEAHLLANLFASFEKERIFTRVMSPLLTTSAIRKRLARQGSKFAAAEAFRLYRFRSGAWSEIILGAVMGAARRVEGEKRRRRREEELFGSVGPELAPPGQASTGRGAAQGGSDWRVRTAADGREPNASRRRRTATGPRLVPTAGYDTGSSENVILHPAVGRQASPARTEPAPADAPPSPVSAPQPPPSPVEAAGANTTSAFDAARNVTDLMPAPVAPTVTVSAPRESVTYTLPASEARLPDAIRLSSAAAERASLRPLSQTGDSAPAGADEAARGPAAPADRQVPPPITASRDDPRAIALRFGPQNREG